MSVNDVTARLAGLREEFDRSFAEPARQHDVEYVELLAVRAGGRAYALRLSQASGVHSGRPITSLPGPQAALLGVAGFSGAIVPVYDLAALLGHPVPESPRWLVLAAGSPPLALAFHRLDGHVRVLATTIVDETDAHASRDVLRGMVCLPGGTRPIVDLPSARAVVHQLTGHTTHNTEER
jgi:chemotaxis signal transduction protein